MIQVDMLNSNGLIATHRAVARMRGQVLEGTVELFFRGKESIEDGAVISVVHNEDIVRGRLHRSQVSHDNFDKVSDVFSVGDKLKVRSAYAHQACCISTTVPAPFLRVNACMHHFMICTTLPLPQILSFTNFSSSV